MSENETPEWLAQMSGRLALWLDEAVNADELPWETHKFPIVTTKHGLVYVEVRLTR